MPPRVTDHVTVAYLSNIGSVMPDLLHEGATWNEGFTFRPKPNSWVASVVCTEFATSWRQSRRVWTNLPTAKSSCVVSRCERTRRQSWLVSRDPVYSFLCCWAIGWNCKPGRDSRQEIVHTADADAIVRENVWSKAKNVKSHVFWIFKKKRTKRKSYNMYFRPI